MGHVARMNNSGHTHELQHTATHCNALQQTATKCNKMQRLSRVAPLCIELQRIETHGNTLMTQHSASCMSRVCVSILHELCVRHAYPSSHLRTYGCNTPQHTAAYCNTLQHTAAHCSTLQYYHHHDSLNESLLTSQIAS